MDSNQNRFDLLRLVFASAVFLYHGVTLSAFDVGGELERTLGLVAEVSIQGFFIVSGALVYGSLDRSQSVADYAGKRVRRLYPAYAVIILIPALVSLALVAGQPAAMLQIARYVGANLIFLNFLEPNLPGLFEAQRFTEVNGALWTLKIEVMFYLVLPVLAWLLSRFGRYWLVGIAILYVGALFWNFAANSWDHPLSAQLARQLPGQLAFFASGMLLWKFWGTAKAKPYMFGLVGAVVLIAAITAPILEPLRALGLTGVIAWAAFAPGPHLNAARFGDVSYGVYITHFPIVQGLLSLGILTVLGPVASFGAAVLVVFAVSFTLWWFVEKPVLRRDSHYRRMSQLEG